MMRDTALGLLILATLGLVFVLLATGYPNLVDCAAIVLGRFERLMGRLRVKMRAHATEMREAQAKGAARLNEQYMRELEDECVR